MTTEVSAAVRLCGCAAAAQGRACTPMSRAFQAPTPAPDRTAIRLASAAQPAPQRRRTAQLFLEVCAKNWVGRCSTVSLPHFGQRKWTVSCSATCSTCSKSSPHFTQRYWYVGMAVSTVAAARVAALPGGHLRGRKPNTRASAPSRKSPSRQLASRAREWTPRDREAAPHDAPEQRLRQPSRRAAPDRSSHRPPRLPAQAPSRPACVERRSGEARIPSRSGRNSRRSVSASRDFSRTAIGPRKP